MADVERRKSVFERLLDGLTESGPAGAAGFSGFTAIVDEPGPRRDSLRGLIVTVLAEIAERGNVVIVAHAASLALAARTDVLRVLITASPETRAQRLAEAQGMDEAKAEKLVARGDANRADYLKRFYSIPAELPTHYDIALNTDRISPEDAATWVLSAARLSGSRSDAALARAYALTRALFRTRWARAARARSDWLRPIGIRGRSAAGSGRRRPRGSGPRAAPAAAPAALRRLSAVRRRARSRATRPCALPARGRRAARPPPPAGARVGRSCCARSQRRRPDSSQLQTPQSAS